MFGHVARSIGRARGLAELWEPSCALLHKLLGFYGMGGDLDVRVHEELRVHITTRKMTDV